MWYNPMMIWLIRSPLHSFVSKNMMLITYTGRKSGESYTVPVNYLQDGETLYITSLHERTWWRNLRDGQSVSLHLRGKDIQAKPQVAESDQEVAALLDTYFQLAPQMTRYFEINLDENGKPMIDDLAQAAKSRIMVVLELQA